VPRRSRVDSLCHFRPKAVKQLPELNGQHEPELYTCVASDVCCQIAAKKDQVPFAMTSKGALTRTFVVAGTGFEPVTSGL